MWSLPLPLHHTGDDGAQPEGLPLFVVVVDAVVVLVRERPERLPDVGVDGLRVGGVIGIEARARRDLSPARDVDGDREVRSPRSYSVRGGDSHLGPRPDVGRESE